MTPPANLCILNRMKNNETRPVKVSDFLTEKEIRQAVKLKGAKEIEEKIIAPNIDRINHQLGQKNDPRYLAYAVSFAISQSR